MVECSLSLKQLGKHLEPNRGGIILAMMERLRPRCWQRKTQDGQKYGQEMKTGQKTRVFAILGGGAGIRTLGEVTPTTVFETVPFNRSGTPPRQRIDTVFLPERQ